MTPEHLAYLLMALFAVVGMIGAQRKGDIFPSPLHRFVTTSLVLVGVGGLVVVWFIWFFFLS